MSELPQYTLDCFTGRSVDAVQFEAKHAEQIETLEAKLRRLLYAAGLPWDAAGYLKIEPFVAAQLALHAAPAQNVRKMPVSEIVAWLERQPSQPVGPKPATPAAAPNDTGDPPVFTREERAILFVRSAMKTNGKLPTKVAIAKLLEVTPRTLNNWKAFKVAYAKLKASQQHRVPRGSKSSDGELEAWRENRK